VDSVEWIGDVAIIKDRSGEDPRVLAERFKREPEVEFAEPDYLAKQHAEPNDPSYGSQQWNFQLLSIPRAWDIEPGGSSNIIVAIVDSGMTSINATNVSVKTWNGFAIIDHVAAVAPSPDFTLSRFVQPRDFTVTPATPGTVVIDTDDHGTHVAGTVGEDTNNGFALAGIAYGVRLMPLKACVSFWDVQFAWSAGGNTGFVPSDSDGCANSATSAAIRYAADNGAKVLNYSIGGNSPNQTILSAMSYAISKGTFIAMSNGNDFGAGNPTTYPAAYGPQLQGAISVAATNRSDNRASYSSTGSYTEIAAPGGDSSGFVVQLTLRGSDHALPPGQLLPRFDRYDQRGFSGTSMASPHVAGLAALLASRGITDPALIEGIIKSSARDLGDPGRDNAFGYGRVQPFIALFGQGIVR
jgi:serine protease